MYTSLDPIQLKYVLIRLCVCVYVFMLLLKLHIKMYKFNTGDTFFSALPTVYAHAQAHISIHFPSFLQNWNSYNNSISDAIISIWIPTNVFTVIVALNFNNHIRRSYLVLFPRLLLRAPPASLFMSLLRENLVKRKKNVKLHFFFSLYIVGKIFFCNKNTKKKENVKRELFFFKSIVVIFLTANNEKKDLNLYRIKEPVCTQVIII